jgi:6-phosphogluconolactonase (cycloisomerase 2 family)
VSFDTDGDVLVVSEKAATQMVSYSVAKNGSLSTTCAVTPSSGSTPFGFGITKRNVVVVSEAGTSSASSYRIGEGNERQLHSINPAVANGQGAACWIAVTARRQAVACLRFTCAAADRVLHDLALGWTDEDRHAGRPRPGLCRVGGRHRFRTRLEPSRCVASPARP